jgi:hypothetical protein
MTWFQPTASTPIGSSLRTTGSKWIETAPVARVRRCETCELFRASSTKNAFPERNAWVAPEGSPSSWRRIGGEPWRPWLAVITSAPEPSGSIRVAKRPPVIVQAAEQITWRATSASVVREISRVASVTAAMLTISWCASSWLARSCSAWSVDAIARARSSRTSLCTV